MTARLDVEEAATIIATPFHSRRRHFFSLAGRHDSARGRRD